MTKRIRKIGIAARLTAVVAVILAVFVGLWTFKLIENAQVVAAYRAGMEVNDICWRVEHTLVEKGYDPDDMPSANTPEYDKMRCDLAYSIWDSEKAYVVQYYDGQENWVTMRSPLLLYGKNADADIDISDFSEKDIREMREVYGPKKGFSDGVGYIAMIYGKKIENNGHTIYIPNRICVGAYDYEWTAQTPVEEVGQWEATPIQWCFDEDYCMEAYFAAREAIAVELRCINGEDIKDKHETENAKLFSSGSNQTIFGRGVIVAAAPIEWETAYDNHFYGMAFVTNSLYILFLFLFYKLVRRMITNPLDETAREANLVANLAFDEFQPDLKRGDEIGELNRALSEMAATLHTRWDSERDLEDKRQQFVSAASHDLKTPLALIGGYAEAIAQDISPEENARYLAAIEQETARMNGLVREMLDYTRLDRTDELKNRKTLNLTALVRDVLTEYAPLFEKRRLTADIADGVRIRGDETLLRRAVGCLLENAAKYSPENGRVSVRLTNARNDLLTVENDCEPIPEDELPRLFEMFYHGDKARDRAGGHGLGLAILQKILALHGLTCKAENVKNGVRFIVCNKD